MKLRIIGLISGLVLGLIFYKHWVAMVVLSLLGCYIAGYHREVKDKLLQMEFKEFLNSIYGELMVSQSFRNAISETLKIQEFKHLELENSVVVLNRHLQSGVSEVAAWMTFSDSLDEPFIDHFVETLEAVYNYSGHITYVIRQSIIEISDAIDLCLEIEVLIAAKRFEFLTMMLSPIVLMGCLMLTQYDYVRILYETIFGRIIMTSILIVNGMAFIIGKRIINII